MSISLLYHSISYTVAHLLCTVFFYPSLRELIWSPIAIGNIFGLCSWTSFIFKVSYEVHGVVIFMYSWLLSESTMMKFHFLLLLIYLPGMNLPDIIEIMPGFINWSHLQLIKTIILTNGIPCAHLRFLYYCMIFISGETFVSANFPLRMDIKILLSSFLVYMSAEKGERRSGEELSVDTKL